MTRLLYVISILLIAGIESVIMLYIYNRGNDLEFSTWVICLVPLMMFCLYYISHLLNLKVFEGVHDKVIKVLSSAKSVNRDKLNIPTAEFGQLEMYFLSRAVSTASIGVLLASFIYLYLSTSVTLIIAALIIIPALLFIGKLVGARISQHLDTAKESASRLVKILAGFDELHDRFAKYTVAYSNVVDTLIADSKKKVTKYEVINTLKNSATSVVPHILQLLLLVYILVGGVDNKSSAIALLGLITIYGNRLASAFDLASSLQVLMSEVRRILNFEHYYLDSLPKESSHSSKLSELLESSSVVVVTGKSGAGKTTLLKSFTQENESSIFFDQVDISVLESLEVGKLNKLLLSAASKYKYVLVDEVFNRLDDEQFDSLLSNIAGNGGRLVVVKQDRENWKPMEGCSVLTV